MRITIHLNTQNAALEDNPNFYGLLDIFTTVAHRIASYGEYNGVLRDSDGNRVGEYDVKGDNKMCLTCKHMKKGTCLAVTCQLRRFGRRVK